jgi:hypothetical protein
MNNPDHISESLETIFGVKILKFFDADPGSRMGKNKSPDPAGIFVLTEYFLKICRTFCILARSLNFPSMNAFAFTVKERPYYTLLTYCFATEKFVANCLSHVDGLSL